MRIVSLLLCCVGLLAASSSSARGEDWPRFRGPTGQGISAEKDVPLEWGPGKNVAWQTPIPGEGWSSPIVWGDRVFVTSTTDGGATCHIICVDVKSGKVLWDTPVMKQATRRKEGMNSYATPTPVTDGKRVYAVFGSGSIAAVNFADGKVAWTNADYPFYSQHGLGASPIVHGDLLVMPFDGSSEGDDKQVGWKIPWDEARVIALDVNTGKERWAAKRGKSRISHMTPIVVDVGGKPQLISPAGDVVQGFDLGTGERIWSVYSQGEGVTPSPVAGDGLLFTSSGFEAETIRAIKLDAAAKGDVTKTHVAWEQKRAVPTRPSFVYHDGLLFSLKENGIALCLEAKTGEVVWQERLDANFSASPVYAAGRIYFLAENGETTVIEAGRSFKELAMNPLPGHFQASPAVADGRIFIRSDKELFCLGASAANK
jgi:outer membrane protein assembly factor BamB